VSVGDSQKHPFSRSDSAAELCDAVARPRWLRDEESSPEEVEILRATPGQQRLKVAEQMFWMARKLKAAGFGRFTPNGVMPRLSLRLTASFCMGESELFLLFARRFNLRECWKPMAIGLIEV
jgi:hypothetical protein